MIEFVAGILAGVAAHQTDRLVSNWPQHWEYITRYVIGVLTGIMIFSLMLGRLNKAAVRDGLLSIAGAFGSVGLGVAGARLFDEVIK